MAEENPEVQGRYIPGESRDEIDLADVVLAIWRRRWLFVGTFATVFGLSLAYAFLVTPDYRYSTTIEIGYIPNGMAEQRIESAESVKDRVQRLYIPSVLYELREDYGGEIKAESIDVSVPEDSGIVVLSRDAPNSRSERNLDLLDRIVQRVKSDHDQTFNLVASEHRREHTNAENALDGLKARETMLKADLERLDRTAELLQATIQGLETSIGRMEAQREQVATAGSNEDRAMTLLLIDNQIQSNQRRLEEVRERLEVKLEAERDQLEDSLGDNQRAQENQRQTIASLEAKGEVMRPTRPVIPPMRSLNPVSPNRPLVLALGFVVAGALGVLAVGISGLSAAARRKWAVEE